MMLYQRQSGFTLVELMVAMAIGTLITLGAGQLFLTTFQTFKKVDELSRKQETVVFLTQILAEELRKEDDVDRYALSCSIADAQCLCTIRDTDKDNQPVINFYKDFEESHVISDAECSDEPLVRSVQDHHYEISVPIMKGGESLIFHVTKRDIVTTTNPE